MASRTSEPELLDIEDEDAIPTPGRTSNDDDDLIIDAEDGIIDADEDDEDDEDDAIGEVPLPDDAVKREIPRNAYTLPAVAGSDVVAFDPLTTYLAQLRHVPPLPAEQQQALAEAYVEDGDVEAAKQLIMSNLRLVVKIAREYHRRRVSLMELIQEGNVGLAEAIRRYDPYRGVKFTSYAQYWIRAMILNYLMNVMQLVKVGNTRSGRKLFYNLRKARDELVQQGFLTPTTRQLADHLDVKEEEVVAVGRILDGPALSFDAPAPGYESTTLAGVIADAEAPLPDELAQKHDFDLRVRTAVTAFRDGISDTRERAIWDKRVIAEDPLSLQELGDEFEVSRERIRQVEKALKDRFKKYWVATVGEDEALTQFDD
jgi:RNA polymerase sigma-32 factor